jgi:hypothetical protein
MNGSLIVPCSEVAVPLTAPGEECRITVQLETPHLQGKYNSNWQLYDTQAMLTFGHRIYCSVHVDPVLAPPPTTAPIRTSSPLQAEAPPICCEAPPTGGTTVDVALSTEDLFAFVKTLEMTANKNCGAGTRPGPLAVPTNTPLVATPPTYRADVGLSRVSSSSSISSLPNEAGTRDAMNLNMAVMA